MKDKEYIKKVWKEADNTMLYNEIINDLTNLRNERIDKYERAKNKDDYAKVTIWVNFLWKYIVQLVNDMVCYVWEKEGWEESEDEIRNGIWLSALNRYEK